MAENTTTDSNSTQVTDTSCKPDYNISVHLFVIPAVIIILILSFLNKRVNKRKCLGGRPGLVIPVDMLSGYENRFTFAMAFGSASYSVTLLFWGQIDETYKFLHLPGPWWINAFTTVVSVLEIGILEYPTLACLTTPWKLTGSLTGFAYTLARMAAHVLVTLACTDEDAEKVIPGSQFIIEIPVYICRLFLLGRFLLLIFQHLHGKFCRVYDFTQVSNYEEIKLASKCDVEHVKLLLVSIFHHREDEHLKLQQKIKNAIYKRQSDFKYPLQIIAALFVTSVLIYEILIAILIVAGIIWKQWKDHVDNKEYLIFTGGEEYYYTTAKAYKVLVITIIVAVFVGVIHYILQICHLLKCHRDHMLKFYRSERNFVPQSLPSASGLVALSFRYSGYQVSYMVWGFLILVGLLFALTGGLAMAILLLPFLFNAHEFVDMVVNKIIGFLPFFAVTMFLFVVQKILAVFVFRNRSIPDSRITIDNRRLFLVFWFIFFFFNIIVGFVSCLLRIVKNMVVGVIFIGRLDRSGIVEGFENLDKGYMAYLGFLFVQSSYRNPVALVFLQMLHDGARRRGVKNDNIKVVVNNPGDDVEKGMPLQVLEKAEASKMTQERKSRAITFKWQVAYTLVNNPIILHDRRKNVIMAKIKGSREEEKRSYDNEILPI